MSIYGTKSEGTNEGYASDWRQYERWCNERGFTMLTKRHAQIVLYLDWLAGRYKYASIVRKYSAVKREYVCSGYGRTFDERIVSETMGKIRRALGTAQEKKIPIGLDGVMSMVDNLDCMRLADKRDRALLLVMYHAALRRSEATSLNVDDIEYTDCGATLYIRRSKTDQKGAGSEIEIARKPGSNYCPVRALSEWLDASGIDTGAIFRPIDRHGNVGEKRLSGTSVSAIIKKRAGGDGRVKSQISSISLRSGHVTDHAEAIKIVHALMKRGRWKNFNSLMGYYRPQGVA